MDVPVVRSMVAYMVAPCTLRVLLVFHPSDVTIKVAGTTDATSGKFLPAFSSLLYFICWHGCTRSTFHGRLHGCGSRTWTGNLRVMSPTSYQLLHPASFMVEGEGFEPSKAVPTDLQSAPFGHLGIPPGFHYGAEHRTWTRNLLITNQLLYRLS